MCGLWRGDVQRVLGPWATMAARLRHPLNTMDRAPIRFIPDHSSHVSITEQRRRFRQRLLAAADDLVTAQRMDAEGAVWEAALHVAMADH